MINNLDYTQQIAIILIKPQMGENIGATARAMLNCGLTELRLVSPRDGWPNEKAQAMSSGALDKMPAVKVFDTTADALADLHSIYATTAREREINKMVFTAREAADDVTQRIQSNQKIGIVFGGERAGLDNDDIALCQHIINMPLNPEFSSLNLGQAVLLVCYDLYNSLMKADLIAIPQAETESQLANHDELNRLFERLEDDLEAGHFFRTQEMRPTIMRNIKAMLTRSELSKQEVRTFHGMLSALSGKKHPVKKRNKA